MPLTTDTRHLLHRLIILSEKPSPADDLSKLPPLVSEQGPTHALAPTNLRARMSQSVLEAAYQVWRCSQNLFHPQACPGPHRSLALAAAGFPPLALQRRASCANFRVSQIAGGEASQSPQSNRSAPDPRPDRHAKQSMSSGFSCSANAANIFHQSSLTKV
jgi:hypothetical protein